MRAALRGQRYVAKALWAQFGFGRGDRRGVKLSHQRVHWHHNQEVKGSGDEHKRDQDVEKLTVLDDAAVDVDHQEGKIGLVHDSRDEGVDDISNQRANNRCKCGTDHNCDRKIDYVAAQDKVAKSFKHGLLLSWEFTRRSARRFYLRASRRYHPIREQRQEKDLPSLGRLFKSELEPKYDDVVLLAKVRHRRSLAAIACC